MLLLRVEIMATVQKALHHGQRLYYSEPPKYQSVDNPPLQGRQLTAHIMEITPQSYHRQVEPMRIWKLQLLQFELVTYIVIMLLCFPDGRSVPGMYGK